MAMSLESPPLKSTMEVDGIAYIGSETWGNNGLVRVVFKRKGEHFAQSDLFEPADLAFAWDQAEHRMRFHHANQASQLQLI